MLGANNFYVTMALSVVTISVGTATMIKVWRSSKSTFGIFMAFCAILWGLVEAGIVLCEVIFRISCWPYFTYGNYRLAYIFVSL